MEIITCPNCGKLIDKKNAKQMNNTIHCPKCGMVPMIEDNEVITISGGEIGGAGIASFENDSEGFVIREGVESPSKQEFTNARDLKKHYKNRDGEETVISGNKSSEDTISLNHNTHNVPEATVEEKLDFEWKRESKDIGHPLIASKVQNTPKSSQPKKAISSPKQKHVQRSRSPQKRPDKLRTTQRNRRVKKPPFYYFIIFYGIPSILVLSLIIYTAYKYYKSSKIPENKIVITGPQALWDKARDYYQEGYVNYQEFLMYAKKNKKKSFLKLKEADKCYKKALEFGKRSWEEQVQLWMKEKTSVRMKLKSLVLKIMEIIKKICRNGNNTIK